MTSYFVAGTGTGIGKTFTTCALLHAARARDVFVHGYKPVISGWDGSPTMDTLQIIEAAGGTQTIEEVSPWRFAAPLAPNRAALREGKSLPFDELVKWTDKTLAAFSLEAHEYVQKRPRDSLFLVETAGGIMSPLTDQGTVINWIEEVGLKVILVGGTYLGSVSHLLTALQALRYGDIAAVVINETAGSTVPFDEAVATLEPYLSDIPLRTYQPLVSSWREATEIHQLAELL